MHIDRTVSETNYVNSGNVIVSAEAFRQVGGFAEELTTGEDADLGRRLRASGFKVRVHPEIRVFHLRNPKSLSAFWRKEIWHAVGMWEDAVDGHLPLVLRVSLVQLVAILFSLVSVVFWPHWFLLFIVVPWIIPAAAVIHRIGSDLKIAQFFPGMILFQVYFFARLSAAFPFFCRFLRKRIGTQKVD